jgi:Tol biopolymer transport system component
VPRPLLAVTVALAMTGAVLAGVVSARDDRDDAPVKVTTGTTSTTTPANEPARPGMDTGTSEPDGLTGGPGAAASAVAAGPDARNRTTTRRSTGTTTTTAATATLGSPTTTTNPLPNSTAPTQADPIAYPTGPADPLEMDSVYVVSVSDGVPHRVAKDDNLMDRSVWSADGRRLLYGVQDVGAYTRDADGSDPKAVGGGGIETPAWSRQGSLAVVDVGGSGHDVVLISPIGTKKRITQAQVGAVSGRAWSPDGTHIAIVADGRVWRADANANGLTALTPAGGKAWRWLKWSPDGTRIAYYEAGRLVVMNADGTDRHDVAAANADPSFAWSPDSTRLAVGAPAADDFEIGIVSAAGGPVQLLGAQGIELSWSPDGSTIAFKMWPPLNKAIAVGLIGVDGSNKRVLVAPPKGIFFGLGIDWSPDATHLLLNTGIAGSGGPPEPP